MSEEEMEKYYNIFINGLRDETKVKVPDDYLTKEFTISGEEVIANYDGIVKAIKKVIE